MKSLFYDTKNKAYVMIKPCFCDFCKQEVNGVGVNYRYYGRRNQGEYVVCSKCTKGLKTQVNGVIIEYKSYILSEELKDDFIAVLPKCPSLQNGDVSVFEAAEALKCPKVVDYTLHAGRCSLEGASIGVLPCEESPKLIEKRIFYEVL